MNIKDLDLNLLRLFDAVWRTRSVSLAAQQLGMSQPAASQGLARLRMRSMPRRCLTRSAPRVSGACT